MPAITDAKVKSFRQQLQQAGDDPVALASLMRDIHSTLERALEPGNSVSITPELGTLNTLASYVTSRLAEALVDATPQSGNRFVGINLPTSIGVTTKIGEVADFAIKSQGGINYVQTSPGSMQRPVALESMVVRDNVLGGKDLFLANGQNIVGASWKSNVRLDDVLPQGDIRRQQLQQGGVDLDAKRNVLVIAGEGDRDPTILFEGATYGQSGVTVVCTKVQFIPFDDGTGGGRFVLEKPVVYLYPTSIQDVRVQVQVDGEFIAQYPNWNDPKMTAGVWSVKAGPTGEILDPRTERRFPYLFWEAGRATPIRIDASQAHCVAGKDAEAFLEKVAARYALNDRERTDFVSYWLPSLERNKYSLVQLLTDAEYDRYATMTVTPRPDTTIRLFMAFTALNTPIVTGAPEMAQRTRTGFTVIEWGGTNLDRA